MPTFGILLLICSLLCRCTAAYTPSSCPAEASSCLSRRSWWLTSSAAAFTASFLPATPADANTDLLLKLRVLDDPVRGFSLQVPSDWTFSNQVLRDRREFLLWRDPDDDMTALSIAYTSIRDDFTSLASFGSVDQVAAQTILPKGVLAGAENDAKMLSATSANQAYLFDYQQTVPTGTPTHFRTLFALQQGATGGAGALLVTITAQTPEERYGLLQKSFDAILDSFQKSKKA